MEICILTQNNHFLINSSTFTLVQSLRNLGFDVVVLRASATAKGKATSKTAVLSEMFHHFGFRFVVRALYEFFASKVRNRDSKLAKLCRIIDIPDEEKITSAIFAKYCSEYNVLLILSGTRIIRKDVLDLWQHGVLNVHSSILPFAKGLMPALWTFVHRKGMGVSLFRLDEGIDTGEIISQVEITSRPESYFDHLVITKSIGVSLLLSWVMQNMIKTPAGGIEETYNKYPPTSFRLKDYL